MAENRIGTQLRPLTKTRHMSPNVQERIKAMSLPFNSTIRQAMQAIDQTGLGMALLVEPETRRFVGLVTDGDIRRALLNGQGLEGLAVDVPRPEPKTSRVGTSIAQLTSLFSEPVRVIPLLNDRDQVVDLSILDRRIRLPVAEPSLGEKELLNVSECVLSGWVSSSGKFVTQFEKMFAAFCGTRYAVATSSGTTALHLALLALDVGPGDEVIVPTLTFVATANAVTYTGARPIFVDSEPVTWTMDPDQVNRAVTSQTKAIIPVHLYGHPANMEPIREIAEQHGIAVVEDAAEAHGAKYKDRITGGLGDIGIFSFYGNKIITTGEGGMLVTNRSDLAEKARILRDHGMSPERRYWHPTIGYNYRMTNIQAALGVAQMERIESIISTRRSNAEYYLGKLASIPALLPQGNASWGSSVYWLFSVLIEHNAGIARDDLIHMLEQEGIETRPLFYPIHIQPPYLTGQRLPVAEGISARGLSLPSGNSIARDNIAFICERLDALIKGKR